MSTDTRWTRERIDAAVKALPDGAKYKGSIPWVQLHEQVADDLLAERDRLESELSDADTALAERPASSWRLPDWLGGHEVEIVDDHDNGDYTVKTVGNVDGARQRVRVGRGVLVEVRPPSIDEPVAWPWEVRYAQGCVSLRSNGKDGRLTVIEVQDDDEMAAAGRPMAANDLRDLARAAWQRANAVERAS